MKLTEKKKWCTFCEWTCELTRDLDQMSGMDEKLHYLQKDTLKLMGEEDIPDYFIRVPGGTVGSIWMDNENIRDIFIDTGYVVDSYPEDVNERVKKYIGERIETE